MKIKTVAIIGAGAIGSYFIAGLTEAGRRSVDRGRRRAQRASGEKWNRDQ